jgi:hypothetical protein
MLVVRERYWEQPLLQHSPGLQHKGNNVYNLISRSEPFGVSDVIVISKSAT